MSKLRRCAVPVFTALISLAFSSYSGAQDDPPSVSVTSLKGGLHLLQGRGGNVVASAGPDGLLIIDDDYPQYASAYAAALASLDGEDTVRFVLNTHWHGDHTGGNAYWGERGAVIVAHDNVRLRMSTRQDMKALGRVVDPSPAAALPVVTYADSLALHFNGEDIEVQHYPRGHTDGDSVVFFAKANVVHMGDHYFKDAFPFVDRSSGGDVLGFTENIAALLKRIDDQTVVVPGHGGLATKADLERYHQMLTSTTAIVRDALANGLDIPAITAQGLGETWASWGKGFINEESWISFIAGSLE